MKHDLTGTFVSHSAYEEYKRWRTTFFQVVSAYRDVMSLAPMVSRDYDDEVRPRKLVPEFINYKIDIQHATSKALKYNEELIRQWEKVVFDDDDEFHLTHVSHAIVRECARVYSARKLQPLLYLKKIRKGRPDRRSAKFSEASA